MIKLVLNLGEVKPIKLKVFDCVKMASIFLEKAPLEYCNKIPDLSTDGMFQNQFVAAMHQAYSAHNPFTLNPDDIWFIIMQGISNHINLNAEKFRNVMVDFDGKKDIKIEHPGLVKGSDVNDWAILFPQFEDKITQLIKDGGIAEMLLPTFSTSTELDKTCFRIALMDICKSYFSYSVRTMCYLPVINVDGIKEDWIKIQDTINTLLPKFEMEEWMTKLNVILNNIINLFDGNIDEKFFSSIYKFGSGSGSATVSGWVCDLFPYMLNNKKELVPTVLRKTFRGEGINTDSFPPSICCVPFTWNYYGTIYSMNFYAGFLGFNEQDDSIRAVKNYFIAYKTK